MANHLQFGHRVASRKLANPAAVAGLSVVAAAASICLLFLFSWIAQSVDGLLQSLVRVVALFFCFSFVGFLVYGLAALARGAQSFHVFAGGFVHRRNGKLRGLTWRDVAELRPVFAKRGDAAGKILHYQLVPHTGRPIVIPLDIQNGRDEFMDHLIAMLRHYGIRVS